MMRSTYFHLPSFQLAVTVLLAVAPFISATSNLAHPPRRGIRSRDPVIQGRQSGRIPEGWKGLGCYTDNPKQRTLTSVGFKDSFGMTVEGCVNFCNRQKKYYAGLSNGTDCYCGNVLTAGAKQDWSPPNNCTMRCAGDVWESCGDTDRLNLYTSWTAADPPPQPTIVESTVESTGRWYDNRWYYEACYSDSDDKRTLATQVSVVGGPDENSVEKCLSACADKGYIWGGAENANQCWCGSVTGTGQIIDEDRCILACSGNSTQICGGYNSLVLYRYYRQS